MKLVIEKIVSSFAIGPRPSDSKVALVKYTQHLKGQEHDADRKRAHILKQHQQTLSAQAILDMDLIPTQGGEGKGGTATPEAKEECL